MTKSILKSAYRWYLEDDSCDIMDPDGWRDIGDTHEQRFRWFYKPITKTDYNMRRNQCTICEFESNNHDSPYALTIDLLPSW